MVDLVIAHYNEDLSWLKEFNHDEIRHIFVYTKGNHIDLSGYNCKIIHKYLDNVGREIGTILYHCENEYENLPEYVSFLQADPFDVYSFQDIITMVLNPQKLEYMYFWISGGENITSFLDSNLHLNEEFFPWYFPMDASPYNLKEWIYVHLFEENQEEFDTHFKINVPVFWKSSFTINSNSIRNRSSNFYKKLRTKEFMKLNSESGHFLERSYYYLFQLYKQ